MNREEARAALERLDADELRDLVLAHLEMEQQNEHTIEWWTKQFRDLEREQKETLERAEKAERRRDFIERWYGVRWARLRELFCGTEIEEIACCIMANGTASVNEPPRQYAPVDEVKPFVLDQIKRPFFDKDVF